MPGYTELREEWGFTETDNGLQGTRAFVEDPNGVDDLPDIGSPFGSDEAYVYCILRGINHKLYHVVGGVNKKKYMLTYSSRGPGGEPTWPVDTEQRSFQGGAEAISIPPPTGVSNWKWLDGSDAKEVDIFKIVPTGSFTRSIKLVGDAAKNKWIQESFFANIGRINSVLFENFSEGSVYFSGITGGAQYDKYGHRTWIFECQFAWKVFAGKAKVGGNFVQIIKDYWLYVMRPGVATWDKPIGLDGLYLYEKSDFRGMFP